MARLSRFKQKLAGECCWSTPLPQASCAAGELICRRAGRGASSGPEKLRPEEAADGREPKAGGEGEEDQGSRRGRGCGAGMRCYQQVNNVWGVYNTSCPPGAPPELPSSTRQSLPAAIARLWPSRNGIGTPKNMREFSMGTQQEVYWYLQYCKAPTLPDWVFAHLPSGPGFRRRPDFRPPSRAGVGRCIPLGGRLGGFVTP